MAVGKSCGVEMSVETKGVRI